MKRRYRVTPRGKVVFSAAGIVLALVMYMLVQPLFDISDKAAQEESTIGTESARESAEDVSETSSGGLDEDAQSDSNSETSELIEANEPDMTADSEDESEISEEMTDLNESDTDPLDEEKAQMLYNAKTSVYFDPDKYDLKDEYKLVMNVFINIADQYPQEKIRIEGNINGYPKFNDSKFGEELSQIRADQVAQYFMNKGISKERLTVVSNGSSKPLNKSDTPQELMLNRRTDIYFENFFLEEEQSLK